MTAEVLEVHKNGTNPSMVAVIGVKGQAVVSEGPAGISARVQFIFVPSQETPPTRGRTEGETTKEKAAGAPGRPAGRVDQSVTGKGYISKVALAQEISVPVPDNQGRLRQLIRRDLVFERRLSQPGEVAGLLDLPNPDPVADESNSWLLYDDPQGLYHFLHPQELQVTANYGDGGVDLVQQRHEGPDAIHLALLPKSENGKHDRSVSDPFEVKKGLVDNWKRQGQKVMDGPSGWLPEAEWAPLKRKVYRIEAALIPEGDQAPSSGRIYSDQYIVQFMRDEILRVTAMTISDPHTQFRDKVEKIIRSFELGPSDLSLPVAPARVPGYSPARSPAASPARAPAASPGRAPAALPPRAPAGPGPQ